MTVHFIGRWTLAFWLEALIGAVVMMLLGFMSANVSAMLSFVLIASLLLVCGSWLYHGGGHNVLLHLLLYPTVLVVGILGYASFDSWWASLLLSGAFFWRIQAVASSGLSHAGLQRRFVFAIMLCLAQLVLGALFGSQDFESRPYFGMMTLILASYLLLGWGEYVTREEIAHANPPARVAVKITGQLLANRALLAGGYLLTSMIILWLLTTFWSWIKAPLADGLYWLLKPLLQKMSDWIESLSFLLKKDQRVTDLLNNQGQIDDQPYEQIAPGESIFSMLEPYLIGAVVIVCLYTLGRFIWKRRFQSRPEPDQEPSEAAPVTYAPVDSHPDDAQAGMNVSHLFQKPPVQADQVRYTYYQFLQHMAKQGIAISLYETSHEFLRRIQRQWSDADKLDLAARITKYYEQYRYQEHSLTEEDVAAMQACMKQLSTSAD